MSCTCMVASIQLRDNNCPTDKSVQVKLTFYVQRNTQFTLYLQNCTVYYSLVYIYISSYAIFYPLQCPFSHFVPHPHVTHYISFLMFPPFDYLHSTTYCIEHNCAFVFLIFFYLN